MYIYIDESGNFAGDKNNIFIVGGFITGEPRRTSKIFRKWQHRHFPKKIKRKSEVKFTDTGLKEDLRLRTFAFLMRQDIRVFYVFFNIKNIPIKYRVKGSIEAGLLYEAIVEQALQLLLPNSDLEFRILRDFRHLKGLSQAKFNEILISGLAPKLSPKTIFQVGAIDSAKNVNIQIADWICGALFRYFNKGKNGEQYFSSLKNNIVASEELFRDYWEDFIENKKSPSLRR